MVGFGDIRDGSVCHLFWQLVVKDIITAALVRRCYFYVVVALSASELSKLSEKADVCVSILESYIRALKSLSNEAR